MAPNVTGSPTSLFLAGAEVISPPETPIKPIKPAKTTPTSPKSEYRWQIVWRNVLAFVYLHSVAAYAIIQILLLRINIMTFLLGKNDSRECEYLLVY